MPPDLDDPVQRMAYAGELRGVARGVRLAGAALACLGAMLALVRQRGWLALPVWLPAGAIGLAAMLMITARAARARYHRLRTGG